jgi:hypothetical protein
MNAVLDTLNTVLDAVIGALAVALNAVGKTMLANIHATEWTLGLLLAVSCWLIVSRRGNTTVGVVLLALSVFAGAWLSWRTGHTGASVQQVALAALGLHGLLRGRGWALVKKSGAA